MKHVYIFFLCLTCCTSCYKENDNLICLSEKCYSEGFEKRINIEHGDSVFLGVPFQGFKVIDSLLIVNTGHHTNAFSVYSLLSMHKLGSFINRGHASNEIAEVPLMQDVTLYKNDNAYFMAFADARTGFFVVVDLLESAKNNNASLLRMRIPSIIAPKDLFLFYHLSDNDDFAVSINRTTLQWIRHYFKNGKIVNNKAIETLNQYKLTNEQQLSNGALISYYAFNPSKNKVAEIHWHSNQIHLYELNGSLARTIVTETVLDSYLDVPYEGEARDQRYKYVSIKGFEHFFAIHKLSHGEVSCSFLQFYDWNGNPLFEIEFQSSFSAFDIDIERGFIYTFDYESETFMKYNVDCSVIGVNFNP